MKFKRITILFILVLCGLILFLNSCDNSLDPFNTEQGIFSLYGALSLNKETNTIRVKDLNSTLTEEETRDIDVTVTLENLTSGETKILPDSIVKFDDVYTHNFQTDMEILPENRYGVTAERSDGKSIRMETIAPADATLELGPEGEVCSIPIQVDLFPVKNGQVDWTIGFEYNNEIYWTRPVDEDPFSDRPENTVRITFSPQNIIERVFSDIEVACYDLSDNKFVLEYNHYGSGFREESGLDQELEISTATFFSYYMDRAVFEVDTTCASYLNCLLNR